MKADMESLPDDGSTKKDILKGRICFQCLKTKFGLFSRSRRCEMCQQLVCGKCFNKVSVTPFITSGSDVSRTSSSSPSLNQNNPLRSGVKVSKKPGSIVTICHDCKEMMFDIIKPGEIAKKEARKVMLAKLADKEKVRCL